MGIFFVGRLRLALFFFSAGFSFMLGMGRHVYAQEPMPLDILQVMRQALVYEADGDWEDAVPLLKQAAAYTRDNPWVLEAYARVLAKLSREEEALAILGRLNAYGFYVEVGAPPTLTGKSAVRWESMMSLLSSHHKAYGEAVPFDAEKLDDLMQASFFVNDSARLSQFSLLPLEPVSQGPAYPLSVTFSEEGGRLYVAALNGLWSRNKDEGFWQAVPAPYGVSTHNVTSLYYHEGSLVGLQVRNRPGRVVQWVLNEEGTVATGARVLFQHPGLGSGSLVQGWLHKGKYFLKGYSAHHDGGMDGYVVVPAKE